jgi:hypothetical protein
MQPAERPPASRWPGLLCAAWLLALAGCGGGSSSSTNYVGGQAAGTVAISEPSGDNTTEVLIDGGPSGFGLPVANIAYVTVSVCAPGSATACTTIDHVMLDTGSYGLRLLRSKVAALNLPLLSLPADAARGTPAGTQAECYAFVLGALWGPMASADLHLGGETATSLPIQLIDDGAPAVPGATADCLAAANGSLLNNASQLQANGVLGIGGVGLDCGIACEAGDYAGAHIQYYVCPDGQATNCQAAAVPAAAQAQNPIVHFAQDNNGSLLVLPAVPNLGAQVVKGRLVFGIGTQANNQINPQAAVLALGTDPAAAAYLSFGAQVGTTSYPESYIDSGANALFFDDASISLCGGATGTGWYCPTDILQRQATLSDAAGNSSAVAFEISNADLLFSSSSTAFNNLAGTAGQGSGVFAWGLPFFYGRSVYTAIWGQPLATNGPWIAF